MASITDKITDVRNAARPNSARVSSGRSAGGATLACDNLAGWSTASKVHFVTYTIDSNSNPVAGTQLDCYGIVSGNNIGSFTVIDGTDTGNVVNDVVEMLPTAAWGQDLADALTVGHTRTGAHISALPLTSPVLTTPVITDYTSATHTHANAAGGGTLGAAAVPALSLSTQTLSNPYKFSAYRNAVWTTATGSYGLVTFDAENYDTNSNFDTSTGKYTAPVTGYYQINASVGWAPSGDAAWALVAVYKNGSIYRVGSSLRAGGPTNQHTLHLSTSLALTATDYVQIYFYADGGAGATTNTNTWFDGFLMSTT